MADFPVCPSCSTDDFLEYGNFKPAHHEMRQFETSMGSVTRDQRVEPVVEYRCVKCGHFNGHSVPYSWTVPSPNPCREPDLRWDQRREADTTIPMQ